MIKGMKHAFGVAALLSGLAIPATASQLNTLDVKQGTATFTLTEEKTGAIPSCVQTGLEQQWAIELDSPTGRAIYTLLMTAMASNSQIEVESAGDCAASDGIERAKGIRLQSAQPSGSSSSDALYLYKGDGQTKLGRVIGVNRSGSATYVSYVSAESPQDVLSYSGHQGKTGYLFDQIDCQGTAYVSSPGTRFNPYHNGGQYYSHNGNQQNIEYLSILNKDGVCTNYDNAVQVRAYALQENETNFCGSHACKIQP